MFSSSSKHLVMLLTLAISSVLSTQVAIRYRHPSSE